MKRLVEMTIGDRDITIWGKNDLEGLFVRRRGGAESIQDGRRGEHCNVVDGHDKGTNILPTNIADPRGSGVGDDARDKTALADVAFFDLKTKAGMLAGDGRRQFVKTVEWIIRDVQVEEREVHTIGIDNAVLGQILQKLDIGRRFIEIVHPFIEACMGGSLDSRTAKVEVVHDLQGTRIAEKNAKAGVWNNTTVSSSRRTNVDATSKRSKLHQVGERGPTHFIWARRSITVGNEIVEADEVVERIRPEVRL